MSDDRLVVNRLRAAVVTLGVPVADSVVVSVAASVVNSVVDSIVVSVVDCDVDSKIYKVLFAEFIILFDTGYL